MFIKLPISVSMNTPEEMERCERLDITLQEKEELTLARIRPERIESYFAAVYSFQDKTTDCVVATTFSGDSFTFLMDIDNFEKIIGQ